MYFSIEWFIPWQGTAKIHKSTHNNQSSVTDVNIRFTVWHTRWRSKNHFCFFRLIINPKTVGTVENLSTNICRFLLVCATRSASLAYNNLCTSVWKVFDLTLNLLKLDTLPVVLKRMPIPILHLLKYMNTWQRNKQKTGWLQKCHPALYHWQWLSQYNTCFHTMMEFLKHVDESRWASQLTKYLSTECLDWQCWRALVYKDLT